MNTVTIRNITLGNGKPKICLPIVGKTKDEIITQASEIAKSPVDIVEWRADWFENMSDIKETEALLAELRSIISDTPLLYTIRTQGEGGEAEISYNEYRELLLNAAANENVDAVDVEVMTSDVNNVHNLIRDIKKSACVIASSHDFNQTPDKNIIINRLQYMARCGADVCKMAVMPKSIYDVLHLLSATADARNCINQPIVTMSMGKDGIISRISGELFGSCMTFGCVGKSSAPGQIDATELNTILEILHNNL
ncbi:MAG: type I 3-dehydroquinate dehydratase [Lachnospiraceae bacterium]